jgi:hypothetical protein
MLVSDFNKTSSSVVNLNRVAVIDDVERAGFVFELNGRQISALRMDNIDWRLAMAGFACGEVGI